MFTDDVWKERFKELHTACSSCLVCGEHRNVAHECKILQVRIRSSSSDVFEQSMSTGSEPFSLLISLDATIFVLPTSVLILIETICQNSSSKSRLRVQKVQFRLTYVAQKRRCLNTLFFVARLFSRPG